MDEPFQPFLSLHEMCHHEQMQQTKQITASDRKAQATAVSMTATAPASSFRLGKGPSAMAQRLQHAALASAGRREVPASAPC